MSRMDAIKTATINNAMAIGIDDKYGTIEIGKKSDLIILNKDPLIDFEKLKSVDTVIKDGYVYNF